MIRRATESDIPAVVAMARKFLETTSYGALLPTSDEQLEKVCRMVMHLGVIIVCEFDRRGGLFASKPDPELVGMIAMVDVENPITGEQYADEVAWWVEPDARNGSVGPRLLAQAEGWAREKRLHMVKMVAPAGSTVGSFYEKLGYRAVETAYQKAI